MPDKYRSFRELAEAEKKGVDYRICIVDRGSNAAVIAPHGGLIEPGTSQIAEAIAADCFSLYCFEGLLRRPHCDLHITSHQFDEPKGTALVERTKLVVAVHGRRNEGDGSVWLGGLDYRLRDSIAVELQRSNFDVKTTGHRLPGEDPRNICNKGIQLEIPMALRKTLLRTTTSLGEFARAVKVTIAHHVEHLPSS